MELPHPVRKLIVDSFLRDNKMVDDTLPKKIAFWQPWIKNDTEESTKQTPTKQLPTTKWKRDRRTRAEYSRKSDPKVPEVFQDSTDDNGGLINGHSDITKRSADMPLDMSVRQRGLPPSYSQTMNNPGFKSNYRPSVIASNNISTRDELPSGMSMCDPIIDEHFRRSLGKDYVTAFSNNNITSKEIKKPIKSIPKTPSSVIELMDNSGLSVDDHFAKALGDTWLKLNQKDSEIKNSCSSENQVVTI